jgi:hypothetical protein
MNGISIGYPKTFENTYGIDGEKCGYQLKIDPL